MTIDLPPGIDGTAPRVALRTDHRIRDGILGSGWRLEATSVIRRRAASGGVAGNTEHDLFELDGRKLVRVDGIFRLLRGQEPPLLFEPETVDGSILRYFPEENVWRQKRDGWTWTYGSTSETGARATIAAASDGFPGSPDGPVRVVDAIDSDGILAPSRLPVLPCSDERPWCRTLAWHLSKVEDPRGNAIIYDYRFAAIPNGLYPGYALDGAGHHLLDRITWGDGRWELEFDYRQRPDLQLAYDTGRARLLSHRLTELTARRIGGSEYSVYRFAYKDEGGAACGGGDFDPQGVEAEDLVDRPLQTLVRRISRVGASGRPGAGIERTLRCLETEAGGFAWSEPDDASDAFVLDLSGDVPAESVVPIPIQLDGDGITDLLVMVVEPEGLASQTPVVNYHAFIATPGGEQPFTRDHPVAEAWQSRLSDDLGSDHFTKGRGWAVVDIDLDGWNDLIYETEDRSVLLARYRPERTGFVVNAIDLPACALRFGEIADVDGDGYADLVRRPHLGSDRCGARPKTRWRRNLGRFPFFDGDDPEGGPRVLDTPEDRILAEIGNVEPPDLGNGRDAAVFIASQSRLFDINSDGLIDLIYAFHPRWIDTEGTPLCEEDNVCGWITDGDDDPYSRIFWGDGRGGFVDSGLAAGAPLLDYQPSVLDMDGTPQDARQVGRFVSMLDLDRSGRPELLATTQGAFVGGHVWRGLREGYGSTSVAGGVADARGLDRRFTLPFERNPDRGDSCETSSTIPTFGDFDGDGFVDVLTFYLGQEFLDGCEDWCALLNTSERTVSRGRITSSDGSWGGRTELEWGFSADRSWVLVDEERFEFPLNVEVLQALDGAAGRIERQYFAGAMERGGFRGFGLVEQRLASGEVERLAFATSPILAGKPLYRAKVRVDDSLEQLSVYAWGHPVSDDELSDLAPGANPSSWQLDTAAPFLNPLRRRCEYVLERNPGGSLPGTSPPTIEALIEYCYAGGDEVAPSHDQLLAAAGIYRPESAYWPSSSLVDAVWQRNPAASPNHVVLDRARDPARGVEEEWQYPELHRWKGAFRVPLLITDVPDQVLLPPGIGPQDADDIVVGLPATDPAGFSAWTEDRSHVAGSDRPSRIHLHRDVRTTDDDLVVEQAWTPVSLPWPMPLGHPNRQLRLVERVTTDAAGTVLERVERSDFDPAGFDDARMVTRCGLGGTSCRVEHYTWHPHGDLASHVRADGTETLWLDGGWCEAETEVDPLGREREIVFSELCLPASETTATLAVSFEHDAQNRLYRRTASPLGGELDATVELRQQDTFPSGETGAEARTGRLALARLQRETMRLERSYLDAFGRTVRVETCEATPSSAIEPEVAADLDCVAGTERVASWTGWSRAGRPVARAGAHFVDETVPAIFEARDGYGRVIFVRRPAHVARDRERWLDTLVWHGAGRTTLKDPLGRIHVDEVSTLATVRTLGGDEIERETYDARGLLTSAVGRDGIETLYDYDDLRNLAATRLAATAECIESDGGSAACTYERTFEYDALDRLIATTEADGVRLEIERDAIGRPVARTLVDTDGVRLQLTSVDHETTEDGHHRIVETEETGASVIRRFDGLGRQIEEDRGYGVTVELALQDGGRVVQETITDGDLERVYEREWDVHGHLVRETAPGNLTTTFERDGAGRTLSVSDPAGSLTLFAYDFAGHHRSTRRVSRRGDWLLERFDLDAGGRLVREQREGVVYEHRYDRYDRRRETTAGDPAVWIETYEYDASSDRLARTERRRPNQATGSATTFGYDAWGRRIETTDALGGTKRAAYDRVGRIRRTTDEEGYERELAYDARGRVTRAELAGSDALTTAYRTAPSYVYRHDGSTVPHVRIEERRDAADHRTVRVFDAEGRPLAVTFADGSIREQTYVGDRPALEHWLDADGTVLQSLRYAYDDAGRHVERFGPAAPEDLADPFDPATFAGYRITRELDAAGRLVAVEIAGDRTEWTYDPVDGLKTSETWGGVEKVFERTALVRDPDAFPRVLGETHYSQTEDAERTVTYRYDSVARLTGVAWDNGTDTEESLLLNLGIWGRAGRTVRRVNGVDQVVQNWQWDALGRPLQRSTEVLGDPAGTTRWRWLANGVLAARSLPDGTELVHDYGPAFDYELDRIVDDMGSELVRIAARDERGLPTRVELATSRVELGWDAMRRLTRERRSTLGGSLQAGWRGEYDGLGRLQRQAQRTSSGSSSTRFVYDDVGRLSGEERDSDQVLYETDPAGRRTRTEGQLTSLDPALTIAYDPEYPARAIEVSDAEGRATLDYDPWAAQISDQHGNRLERSASGALREIVTADGERALLLRDAGGVPVAIEQPNGRRDLVWGLDAGDRPVQVQAATGQVLTYLQAEGIPLGLLEGTAFTGQMTGNRGSVLWQEGTEVPVMTAFGQGAEAADGDRFVYHALDLLPGTGLQLARHRAYDPQTGRFLSPDPLGLDGSPHRYLYAAGDPVNHFDPMGLQSCLTRTPFSAPDFEFDLPDPMEPRIVLGPSGGPASPFGPGVAVSFVNQAAGDVTFQDAVNKIYSHWLETGEMHAEVVTDPDHVHADTDTDAGAGDNRGMTSDRHSTSSGFPRIPCIAICGTPAYDVAMDVGTILEVTDPDTVSEPTASEPTSQNTPTGEATSPNGTGGVAQQGPGAGWVLLDIGSDFIPIPGASSAKEIGNMAAGRNLITGEAYSTSDYVIGVVSVGADVVTMGTAGGVVGGVLKGGRHVSRNASRLLKQLPNTPGGYIYVLRNPRLGEGYVGMTRNSGGLRGRLSSSSHRKARHLLDQPGTTVEWFEVQSPYGLGEARRNLRFGTREWFANDRRWRNTLERVEQETLDYVRQHENHLNWLNHPGAERSPFKLPMLEDFWDYYIRYTGGAQ
ncbi:RHS repeat-associated core domain-containing protein [Halomonas denitrificans]|nr:hypothetical protein [Halomonas denitrificans]